MHRQVLRGRICKCTTVSPSVSQAECSVEVAADRCCCRFWGDVGSLEAKTGNLGSPAVLAFLVVQRVYTAGPATPGLFATS